MTRDDGAVPKKPDPIGISRRRLISTGAKAAGFLALGSPGDLRGAEECEGLRGRRLSWLVGWSPGGGYDTYSRLLEPTLERMLGAEVVIQSMPGAAGAIAARRIAAARPDGTTLGLLNGTGWLLAPITNPGFAPDLSSDFTILGRIVDHRQVLVTGPNSGIANLNELGALRGRRPLVLGETGAASINVLLAVLAGDLFGVPVQPVLGFPGSQELIAAVLRGDVDGAVIGQESTIGVSDLNRLLYFGDRFTGANADSDVPALDGPGGLFESSPGLFPRLDHARLDAEAVRHILAVGRLVAGPPGLPPERAACLADAVLTALDSPDFRSRAERAGRSLAPASRETVLDSYRMARRDVARFDARLRDVMARVRG